MFISGVSKYSNEIVFWNRPRNQNAVLTSVTGKGPVADGARSNPARIFMVAVRESADGYWHSSRTTQEF